MLPKCAKLKKIKGDPAGLFFDLARRYRLLGYCYLSTKMSVALLYAKGVEIGKNVKFVGVPVVTRRRRSRIKIADRCFIRSDATSNLVGINHRCIFSTFGDGAEIVIGMHVGISGAVIGAREQILIGDDVIIGANAVITDFDWHDISPVTRRTGVGDSKPVVIGNNVWIGMNAIVLKGVTIGENSVIGAGSVVTGNIPANVIAAGNPCRMVKEIEV